MPPTDPYAAWCQTHHCDHGHCPLGHEHPQPFAVVVTGETASRLICGYCWIKEQVITDMVPCVPGVCE